MSAPAEGAPSARRRFAELALASVVGFLAGPGVLTREGSLLLAILGTALWARTAVRPTGGARGLLAEWLAGGLQGGLVMWWATYIVGAGVLAIVVGWGLHPFLAGVLLRRLRARVPLTLAVAIAWSAEEALRASLEPPFGLGWLRLGHHAQAHLWLAGSARVFGLEGLTLVLAALGGALVALAAERRLRPATLAWGLGPLLVAVAAARLVPAPTTVAGPRVLLVQPGFEQERKKYGDPFANFLESGRLTQAALASLRQQGQDPVDLVAWGESMLSVPLFDEDVPTALAQGVQFPPWQEPLGPELLAELDRMEDAWVRRRLLDLLPPGVSFAAGAEYVAPHRGLLRRQVAVVLYDDQGRRQPAARKRHLVPLGETMYGLERFGIVRDLAHAAAGYVPDFLAADHAGLLELSTRAGARYRLGGSVCFDNAFPSPYVDDVRAGAQLHLVSSNEAWFRSSCELDQMVAFSRLLALSTARAVVRATNSGVSLVLAPDGREVGRVRDATGRDRAVAGWGAWTVPVPAPGAAALTPFVRFFPWIRGLAMALGLAALLPRRDRRPDPRVGSRPGPG